MAELQISFDKISADYSFINQTKKENIFNSNYQFKIEFKLEEKFWEKSGLFFSFN